MTTTPRTPSPRLTYASHACSVLALLIATATGTAYAANSVRSQDIVNKQVKNVDLAPDAVTSVKTKDGSIQGRDLKDGTVSPVDVLADSLTAGQLATSSVGAAEIQTDAVGPAEIQDNAIDGGEVAADSLGAIDLATNSVGATEIAADSVGASEMGANAVDSANVIANSLTAADLVGGGGSGAISLPSGAVPNGRCEAFTASTSGMQPGDVLTFGVDGPVQEGVFFYASRVISTSSYELVVCNMSGAAMAAITDLPVRVVSFR